MNTQTIELDIDKRGCGNNCIRIAQGESGGTTIKALVYDNGAEFALAGYTAYLVARLPDRIHYYKGTATVSGNTVTHVCEESKLACVPGYTDEAYFEFTKSSQTVQTERFALDIMRDAREGNAPAQSWDNAVEALEKRAENAVLKGEKATTDATAAVNNANADRSCQHGNQQGQRRNKKRERRHDGGEHGESQRGRCDRCREDRDQRRKRIERQRRRSRCGCPQGG